MSTDSQRTKWRRKIAENFSRLIGRTNVTDRQTTDGRTTTYRLANVNSRSRSFANKSWDLKFLLIKNYTCYSCLLLTFCERIYFPVYNILTSMLNCAWSCIRWICLRPNAVIRYKIWTLCSANFGVTSAVCSRPLVKEGRLWIVNKFLWVESDHVFVLEIHHAGCKDGSQ